MIRSGGVSSACLIAADQITDLWVILDEQDAIPGGRHRCTLSKRKFFFFHCNTLYSKIWGAGAGGVAYVVQESRVAPAVQQLANFARETT
jgi:hypothetical protein